MPITIALFEGDYEYFGGSLSAAKPIPFTVGLNGRDYVVDLKQYRRNGIDTLRAGTVNSSEPNDELFDPQGAWFRYRFNFDHGQGQDVADLDPTADSRRYRLGMGIDPWDKYELELLPATTFLHAGAAQDLTLTATDTWLYLSDGTTVWRTSDLSTFNAVTGITGSVKAMTTDGLDVYIATNSDVYQVGASLLSATAIGDTAGTPPFDSIAFVANRLLAGAAAELWEIGVTATTPVVTHYQAEFRWTTIFNVGSRIYAGGFAGNRSELYSFEALDDGSLARAQEAAPFAFGELLRSALSYGGAVLLCTSLGIRFAQIGTDGVLTYGPVIDEPGDVRCAVAEGRFAWFGWPDPPDRPGAGVGRCALDEFVGALQPAYATDVFTEEEIGDTIAVTRFAGRTIFGISGDGFYMSVPGTYVTEGYMQTGLVYFGTVETKRGTDLRVKFEALDTGEGVAVSVTDEAGESLGSGSVATPDAVGIAVDLDAQDVDAMELTITLTSDGTSTPTVKLWRARAFPVVPAVEQWLVPLVLRSAVVVNDSQGQLRSMNVLTEVNEIIELWRTKEAVAFREGDSIHRVRVDNFEVTPVQWRDDSSTFECTMVVKLVSV